MVYVIHYYDSNKVDLLDDFYNKRGKKLLERFESLIDFFNYSLHNYNTHYDNDASLEAKVLRIFGGGRNKDGTLKRTKNNKNRLVKAFYNKLNNAIDLNNDDHILSYSKNIKKAFKNTYFNNKKNNSFLNNLYDLVKKPIDFFKYKIYFSVDLDYYKEKKDKEGYFNALLESLDSNYNNLSLTKKENELLESILLIDNQLSSYEAKTKAENNQNKRNNSSSYSIKDLLEDIKKTNKEEKELKENKGTNNKKEIELFNSYYNILKKIPTYFYSLNNQTELKKDINKDAKTYYNDLKLLQKDFLTELYLINMIKTLEYSNMDVSDNKRNKKDVDKDLIKRLDKIFFKKNNNENYRYPFTPHGYKLIFFAKSYYNENINNKSYSKEKNVKVIDILKNYLIKSDKYFIKKIK